MKVHPVIHFFGKNTIRLVLLLVFVGIPAAVLYLREAGIGFGAKEALGQALSSKAITVTIGRLGFDPFAGLLANDVRLKEASGGERTLARLSDLVLSLNLSDLTKGKITVDRLVLDNASVAIPIDDDPSAPRLKVEDVHAEILLLGDQLRLSRFDGRIEGIRVVLTGQFQNPDSLTPSQGKGGPKTEVHREALVKLLRESARLRFPDGPPVLSAELEADLADLSTLEISNLTLRSGRIEGRGWKIREVALHGGYSAGVARIPRLIIRDAKGALEISAEWTRATGDLEAALISTLDPAPFLALSVKESSLLRQLRFPKPPQLEARAAGTTGSGLAGIRITGMVDIPEVALKEATLRNVGCHFAWKDGVLYARDLRASSDRGQLTANIWVSKNDYRLDANNSIPPTVLLSLFDPNTRAFLEKMEFKDLPDVSISLRASKLDFAGITGTGKIKLGRTAMRGSWIDSGAADFQIADRCFTYKDLVITKGDGRGTGTFAYDIGRQEARLSNIRSTLMPEGVLMWIDPKIAEAVKPYRFRVPPATVVQGMVHLKDPTKNNLSIDIDSASGLDYDLLGKTLHFGKTLAHVDVVGSTVNANVKRSTLMGGDVTLKAVVSIDPKNPTFGADVQLKRVNFAQLTKLYFDYDDSKGVVSGNYKFDARTGQETLMKGAGSIRVEDGNVFAIPVLGPFSDILSTVIPGSGYETAKLATADFTVANEMINTKNLVIEGRGFSMFGSGDIHFVTSRLDMSMRLNARGIPGLVFYPVSKLFEYISTGTVSDPKWRPKIIPRVVNGSTPSEPPKTPRR